MEAAANLPEGGLTLSHVVELVLIVTITTNFMQYSHGKCKINMASRHCQRYAPFYLATIATPFLCFPKAEVVVGDLMPATQGFTYLPGPKQHSAMIGTIILLASMISMFSGPSAKKSEPLLANS